MIKKYLTYIYEGNDYLLEKRLRYIQIFKQNHLMAEYKIYNFLINN